MAKAEAGRAQGDPRLSQYRQNLGRSLLLAGQLDEAWHWLDLPIDGSAEPIATVTERGRRHLHRAEWLRRRGRLTEVASELANAEAVFAEVFEPGHPRLAAVARVRGGFALDGGEPAAAVALFQRALADLGAALGESAPIVLETRIQLARALVAAGRHGEARRALEPVAAHAPGLFVPSATIHDALADLQARLRRPQG